jgi:hypothetical protein
MSARARTRGLQTEQGVVMSTNRLFPRIGPFTWLLLQAASVVASSPSAPSAPCTSTITRLRRIAVCAAAGRELDLERLIAEGRGDHRPLVHSSMRPNIRGCLTA